MPHCGNCGGHITRDYVRVFSPDGETVRCCPRCDKIRRGNSVREMRSRPTNRRNVARQGIDQREVRTEVGSE